MIKTVVAYTNESQNAELAVSELKSQLKLDENLLTNAIGIVSCHQDFIRSGVMKTIGTAFPFDVMGTVSTASSVGGLSGNSCLSFMLITSDTVDFVNVVTPPLAQDPNRAITESYKDAAIGRYGRPSMVLTYTPFMPKKSKDEFVSVLSKASYNAPCFGAVAMGNDSDMHRTVFNGENYDDRMVMSLFFGSLKPKFCIANISMDRLISGRMTVTKSAGNIIMEIDNRHAYECIEEMGLADKFYEWHRIAPYPIFVDYHDNTPMVARIFDAITPERHVMCGGDIPVGSSVIFSKNEKDDMLRTTGETLDEFLHDAQNASGILIYSCGSRFFAMGEEQFAEKELTENKISGKYPMFMSSAGGEICPTITLNEKSINRFHNNTFVACMF